MYKVEFCLLLWPLDLLSFDALLYFYDNKYVVILILIQMWWHLNVATFVEIDVSEGGKANGWH